jgi:hypothetical protein
MRFVDYVDYGDAPTNFATGIAAITVIAPDVIEVALYRSVQLPSGEAENRIVSRTIWSREQWVAAGLVAAQARTAMQNGVPMARAVLPPTSTSH